MEYLNWYNHVGLTRMNTKGGGVSLYITEDSSYSELGELNMVEDYVECFFVKIKGYNQSYVAGVLYRPPNSNIVDFSNTIKVIRIVTGVLPRTSVHQIYIEQNILPVKHLYNYNVALFMYKHSNDMLPSLFDDLFFCTRTRKLELENNLFDKKYINVSTGYYKHTENDTHCRETLTLVQYVPLSREPPGKYK